MVVCQPSGQQRHRRLLRLEPAAPHQVRHRALVRLRPAVRRLFTAHAHLWRLALAHERLCLPCLASDALARVRSSARKRLRLHSLGVHHLTRSAALARRLAPRSDGSHQPCNATLVQTFAPRHALRDTRRACSTQRRQQAPCCPALLRRRGPRGAAAHASAHAGAAERTLPPARGRVLRRAGAGAERAKFTRDGVRVRAREHACGTSEEPPVDRPWTPARLRPPPLLATGGARLTPCASPGARAAALQPPERALRGSLCCSAPSLAARGEGPGPLPPCRST